MNRQRAEGSAEGHAGSMTLALPGVWLFFLVIPITRHWSERGELRVQIGFAGLAAFAVVYLAAFEVLRRRRDRLGEMDLPLLTGWTFVVALMVLDGVMIWGLGQGGSGSVIYISVTAAMVLPSLYALVFIPLLAGALFYSTLTVEIFEPDWVVPFIVLAAGFVMWGVKQIIARNVELVAMREENESLILQQERNRFAQDLHDILGHSLTVITVKAELASRLLDIDLERARSEIDDLERLSRDALADVRRAVHGYKDLSLSAEIARAKQALDTAGITAVLPKSADHVAGPLRELFAWTIREGVTNVIRHSSADTCVVELYPDRVIVSDDGRGLRDGPPAGTGLSGLAERAASAGAALRTRHIDPQGFALEVVGEKR
jgi:two-component system, NarL family, sensor histidine kinase DesK